MKSVVVIFGVILCLVVVNGRHIEVNENENLPETDQLDFNEAHEHKYGTRHRRRSRQMHGYDYYPAFPYYPDHRRDYSRNQDDQFQHIISLLEEISSYVKRPPLPPPRPQPVYIPYPVPYPGAQHRNCTRTRKPSTNIAAFTESPIPDFTIRWPEMEDVNQNWGLDSKQPEVPEEYDENDGARPISFNPIKPNIPLSRPPPPVDHGSSQAEIGTTTRAPAIRRPGICEAAILSCCGITTELKRKDCFANYKCMKTYATPGACSPSVVQRIVEYFANAYAPK